MKPAAARPRQFTIERLRDIDVGDVFVVTNEQGEEETFSALSRVTRYIEGQFMDWPELSRRGHA